MDNKLRKYIDLLKKKLKPGKRGKMVVDLNEMNKIARSLPCPDGYRFKEVVFDAARMDMICVYIELPNGCIGLYDLQSLQLV